MSCPRRVCRAPDYVVLPTVPVGRPLPSLGEDQLKQKDKLTKDLIFYSIPKKSNWPGLLSSPEALV